MSKLRAACSDFLAAMFSARAIATDAESIVMQNYQREKRPSDALGEERHPRIVRVCGLGRKISLVHFWRGRKRRAKISLIMLAVHTARWVMLAVILVFVVGTIRLIGGSSNNVFLPWPVRLDNNDQAVYTPASQWTAWIAPRRDTPWAYNTRQDPALAWSCPHATS
jgi:hypothetical protein